MCPEFASDRMEKDRHTSESDKRQHSDRMSPARTDVRHDSDKNRNIMHSDKWNNNHRGAHLEGAHEQRCSFHRQSHCDNDTNRKIRSERSTSPLDCPRKERAVMKQRSRSRSPGHRKVFSGGDSYTRRETRNDSHTRRRSDNFSSRRNLSQERSPYRSSSSRLSSYTRNARPVEQDRHVDIGSRRSANELESLKYKEIAHLNKEKARWSKSLYSDNQIAGNMKMSGARTSSRHFDEQVADDCSVRRGYIHSNRQSRAELYEDIRPSHRLSYDCEADSSAFSGCRSRDSKDYRQLRINVCDHRHHRIDRHNVVSPVNSRDELNSKSYRDKNYDDFRVCDGDRRRSSPHDRYTSAEDRTVPVRKQRSYSDGRQSAGRNDRHQSENRNVDKLNSNSSFEEFSSKEQKLSERCRKTSPSCVGREKTVAVARDGGVLSVSKEESSISQSHLSNFSRTNQSDIPAADADNKQCVAASDQSDNSCLRATGKSDTVSSSSEYCVVTSWSAADGNTFLRSLTSSVIQSDQQWVGSSNPVSGIHLIRPHWPVSAVMATDRTRLHDLVPTAAVTQLPLLSTKMSTVSASTHPPQKLVVPGMSLNPNLNLYTLPSNMSFNPSVIQPAVGGIVGQYVMDTTYGDSPLLDEPTYNSPVVVNNSSLSLIGSSVSSVRPELMQSMDDAELKKMLDVVTVAKTTLEQTLPVSCRVDPYSQKQQKPANVEHVAEEVKSALKPFFLRSEIDKEEYKDIMRKAVPKIASSKAGIDTKRIREFVASYVAKVKVAQKRAVAAKQHHVVQQQASASAADTVADS